MLSLGIIGSGRARQAYAAALRQAEGVRVDALADPDPAPARDWARDLGRPRVFPSLEALLSGSKVDALLVLSPLAARAGHAEAALRAGKHVLLRAPFSLDVHEVEALLAAGAASGAVLMPALSRRWDPAVRCVVEEAGEDRRATRLRCEWSFAVEPDAGPRAWELSVAERTLETVEIARLRLGAIESVSADMDLQRGRPRAGLANLIATHTYGLSVHRLWRTSPGAAAERYLLDIDDTQLLAQSPGVPGWPWSPFRLTRRRADADAVDITPGGGSAAEMAAADITRLVKAIDAGGGADPSAVSQVESLHAVGAAFASSLENARVALPLARTLSIAEALGWAIEP